MRIIIVRHGETVANATGVIQGHRHGRLTRDGVSQARALGRRLRNEKIDIIFSSDLKRSADTTKEITRYHDAKVHHVKALREMSMGSYEGRKWDAVDTDRKKSGAHVLKFKPANGESYIDLRRRLRKFTSMIFKRYKNKTVLLSTHGIAIRVLLSIYLRIPLEGTLSMHPRNAGLLILEIKNGRAAIIKDEMIGENWGSASRPAKLL